MENYTVIQKLLLLNSISVIIAILITIAHENQRTDTLFATLTIQITYVAISTLNWVI